MHISETMKPFRATRKNLAEKIKATQTALHFVSYQEHPEEYDRLTGELYIATREHRTLIMHAKQIDREERRHTTIRQQTAQLQKPEPVKRFERAMDALGRFGITMHGGHHE